MSNPAESYEKHMVPVLFGPWAATLVEAARLRPGEHVLDVACGTGIVARKAASTVQPGGEVTGVDFNADMLSVARAAAEQEGLVVEWRDSRAEELPFADGSFDVVLCQFALMFFADQAAALAEMRRVLRAEGRVVLSVFQGIERHPFYGTLDEVIKRRLGMSTIEEIYALGDAAKLRTLLTEAGFREVEIKPLSKTARFPDPDGFLAGEIALDTAAIPSMQHLDADRQQAVVAAISQEMAEPLRAVTRDDHVVLPFHVYLAHAIA